MLRDALLCVSAANLFLLPAWLDFFQLLGASPGRARSASVVAAFVAAVASVLLLGLVLFPVLRWLRSRAPRGWRAASQVAFLLLLVTPLDLLCWQIYAPLRGQAPEVLLQGAWSLILVVPMLLAVLAVVYGRRGGLNAARVGVMILAPALPLAVGNYLWTAWNSPSGGIAPLAAKQAQRSDRRIVWVVFDELDERLLASPRPAGLDLPEFERLERESLRASAARPAGAETAEAMTSLLTGREVKKFAYDHPSQRLEYADGKVESLRGADTIFAELRRQGRNSSLMGWFLDYCANLGGSVTGCVQPSPADLRSGGWTAALARLWRESAEQHWIATRFTEAGRYRVPWYGWKERREHLAAYQWMAGRGLAMAGDAAQSLVLLHWPVPHPHGIYSRWTNQLGVDQQNNYVDNVELTDRTLGQIRRSIRAAGLEDITTLIVTSDHPWRPSIWSRRPGWSEEEQRLCGGKGDTRVPFFVHFPSSRRGRRFDAPFSTTVTRDMMRAVFDGRISDSDSLAAWLEQQSALAARRGADANGG
jgi:hypothetical protein